MKNIYEVFDEFELATNDIEREEVIRKNLSQVLVKVLEYTFHPGYRWKIKELPHTYKKSDAPPGMSNSNLGIEMRRIYLLQQGNSTAESLSDRRRLEILIQMLENLEAREAEVIMGILRKDQGVTGLTYGFVKRCFPQMLP
jgi:hypothetical protein